MGSAGKGLGVVGDHLLEFLAQGGCDLALAVEGGVDDRGGGHELAVAGVGVAAGRPSVELDRGRRVLQDLIGGVAVGVTRPARADDRRVDATLCS